jgi:hypothetical protein
VDVLHKYPMLCELRSLCTASRTYVELFAGRTVFVVRLQECGYVTDLRHMGRFPICARPLFCWIVIDTPCIENEESAASVNDTLRRIRKVVIATYRHFLPRYLSRSSPNPGRNSYPVLWSIYPRITILKNDVFWDVTPCRSCKNRRFGGT